MLVIKEWVWKVEVFLTEGDGLTRAEAVLHAGPHRDLRGIGHARLDPDDDDFPEIGDEIAASARWRISRTGYGPPRRSTSGTSLARTPACTRESTGRRNPIPVATRRERRRRMWRLT
jgi:hypothetical protein